MEKNLVSPFMFNIFLWPILISNLLHVSGKVMLGRSDGSIVVISAIQSIRKQLFFTKDIDESDLENHSFFK